MTTEAGRERVAAALRREAGQIASLAALNLLPKISDITGALRAVHSSEPSFQVHGREVEQPDEAAPMIEEGYRRLNLVVSFSLTVEEPALIADDLQWLRAMFGVRGLAQPGITSVEFVFACYTRACEAVIGSEGGAIVRDDMERALMFLQVAYPEVNAQDAGSDVKC